MCQRSQHIKLNMQVISLLYVLNPVFEWLNFSSFIASCFFLSGISSRGSSAYSFRGSPGSSFGTTRSRLISAQFYNDGSAVGLVQHLSSMLSSTILKFELIPFFYQNLSSDSLSWDG